MRTEDNNTYPQAGGVKKNQKDPEKPRFWGTVSFVWSYAQANLAMEMEYRVSFATRLLGVLLSDCMWLAFWFIYFTRFPVVQGWTRNDIVTLWAVLGFGYGLATGVFGNATGLARVIASGNLDFYLTYPRNVLLHTLCSKMDVGALGDVVFGPTVFVAVVKPNIAAFLLFLLSAVLVGCVFLGFTVLTGTMSFFAGNSENLASQMQNALVHFSTYPSAIFGGTVKMLLFTIVPAGFINSVPVKIMRDFDPVFFLGLAGAAVVFLTGAIFAFKSGMKRYESGNLMQAKM